jgi:RNA polymerase sigma factor (sigma-70 family)
MTGFADPVLRYAPPMREGTPGQWVREAADGNAIAWECLVDQFTGLLWSITRSFRLSSAESADVVQTTWLRLVEHLGRIEQPERVGAWLATTARNECLAALRRHRGDSSASYLDELPDSGPGPDDELLRDERNAALWHALDHLSDACRTLLRVLATDPPPSYLEVSAALGMPVGSIGPSRARCLEHLRRRMSAAGVAEGSTG